jgi:hypothetical protein
MQFLPLAVGKMRSTNLHGATEPSVDVGRRRRLGEQERRPAASLSQLSRGLEIAHEHRARRIPRRDRCEWIPFCSLDRDHQPIGHQHAMGRMHRFKAPPLLTERRARGKKLVRARLSLDSRARRFVAEQRPSQPSNLWRDDGVRRPAQLVRVIDEPGQQLAGRRDRVLKARERAAGTARREHHQQRSGRLNEGPE